MINFSKVAQQLNEEPFNGVDRHQSGNEGNWATNAEKSIIENVLQKKKPNSKFEHLGGNNIKTDVLETDSNNNQTGYSIKATKNPNIPTKMHQSGAQLGSSGSFRKLVMPGSDDSDLFTGNDSGLIGDGRLGSRFREAIGDHPAGRGYLMAFGSRMGSDQGQQLKDFISDMNSDQRELFDKISSRSDRPFVSPNEMKEFFGDDYDNFMQHLTDNKSGIFSQLVRQNQAKFPGSNFKWGDDFPTDRLAHLRSGSRDGRIFSDRFGGTSKSTFDIRDVSDDAINQAMENLNWYSDDDSFYMAEEETDDWNKRALGVYPNSQNVDRWGAMPGRDRYNLRQQAARAQPGLLKATMGIDEDMLNSVFGDPLYSAEINSRMNDGNEEVTRVRDLIRGGKRINEGFLNNNKTEEMDFSKLHLSEGMESTEAAISSSEKAMAGGEKQREGTRNRRTSQKNQMSQQGSTPVKSDVSYASEEYRSQREYTKMMEGAKVDWRADLKEAMGPNDESNHPYVDVMPSMNQKADEAKKQMKQAALKQGGAQAKMANEEMSVADQLKASREYFKKRNARSPEEKAAQEKSDAKARAKNFAANRNNNIGQFDHSKRND